MQDGAEVKTTQSPEDIAATLESNTKKAEKAAAEFEKQARAEREERSKQQKAREEKMKGMLSPTGVKGGLGVGTSTPKSKTGGAPDETAEMAAADKFAEENNKFNQTVQMFIDEAQKKYSNDADGYAKFLNAGIETIKRGASKFTIAETSAAIQEQKDLMNNVIQVSYANYWTGKGRPDLAAMALRAESMVGGKQNPNRAGMDKLINDGAPQVEMPEIPDDENAYLAEVITGMVGDIVSNSIAWASGGSTAVAAASVPSAGQQVSANVSAMMATDVKEHREKVEKIRLLNEELRIKHQGDVIAAMVDFDSRVDASERTYNQMLFQAKGAELARAYELLGMKQDATKVLADMARAVDTMQNAYYQYEDGKNMAVKVFNADAKNRVALEQARHAYDSMMVEAKIREYKQKNMYVPYENINKMKDVIFAQGVGMVAPALETIVTQRNTDGSLRNEYNYNSGFNHGLSGFNAINRLPLDAKQKGTIINNILVMGMNNYSLNDLSESTLTELSKEPIVTSPMGAISQSGGGLVKFFTPRLAEERNLVLGSMHAYLDGAASTANAAIRSTKNKVGKNDKMVDIPIVQSEEE